MTLDFGAVQSIVRSLELLAMGLVGIVVAAAADRLRRKQLAAAALQETTHAHV